MGNCIKLESEDGISPPHKVLVEYDKLPIRCRACHSWKHKVSECGNDPKQNKKEVRHQPQIFQRRQKNKNKRLAVDADDFFHVRNMKGTRRNIFDEVNDDLRHLTKE